MAFSQNFRFTIYIQFLKVSHLVSSVHSKSESVTHACLTTMAVSELDTGIDCKAVLLDVSSLSLSVFGYAVPLT